jgi:hypothetical protein
MRLKSGRKASFARQHHVPLVHDFAYATVGSQRGEQPISLLAQPTADGGIGEVVHQRNVMLAGERQRISKQVGRRQRTGRFMAFRWRNATLFCPISAAFRLR